MNIKKTATFLILFLLIGSMIIPTVIGDNTSLESDGESPNNMLGVSTPSYNMYRKIINILSKININTDILRFLLDHQVVRGMISYSDGSNIPNGVAVTITDLNNGNSATRYTQQSTVYGPGFYIIDVYDLGANQGDIIFVCVNYGGCTGNASVVLDITGPPHTLNVTIYGNLPPAIPSQPSGPTTGNKNIQYTYSTSTTDPNGNNVYYWFDWNDGTNSGWLGPYTSGQTVNASHSWNNYGTYQVKAKAKDIYGAELGICWSNPLNVNIVSQPPNTPNTPSGPTFLNAGASGTYSTSTIDPEGDQVQYRFDWDANGSHDYSGWTSFVPSGSTGSMSHAWSNGGTYVVKAQARDTQNATSGWSDGLTVFVNSLPYTPSNPSPSNGTTNVNLNISLSWSGGDPNPGDAVAYDVYFGTTSSPPKIVTNQSTATYDPGVLDYGTKYYWKIVAWDNHAAMKTGPVWHFTTENILIPDLDCTGSLGWTKVPAGSTVTGSFTVKNIGEPFSELDWAVVEWPNWGTWTFVPSNGTDLTPEDGTITVQVSVVAPNQQNQEFTGNVKVVNLADNSDYENISVSLVTPVSQMSSVLLLKNLMIHSLLIKMVSIKPFFLQKLDIVNPSNTATSSSTSATIEDIVYNEDSTSSSSIYSDENQQIDIQYNEVNEQISQDSETSSSIDSEESSTSIYSTVVTAVEDERSSETSVSISGSEITNK